MTWREGNASNRLAEGYENLNRRWGQGTPRILTNAKRLSTKDTNKAKSEEYQIDFLGPGNGLVFLDLLSCPS